MLEYNIKTDENGKPMQITKIAPYDEQEYHWAKFEIGKRCKIIRIGHIVKTLNSDAYTVQEIIEKLMECDEALDLKCIRAIY
jgi:hypothetical protein